MLEDISLFFCLDDEALQNFEQLATRKRFPKNTIVFSKGDESDSLYIIQSGRVKAVIHDTEGKEIVLSLIGSGEYFGEMAALDGVPRSATIVTKEPTEMLIVHRNDFKSILASNPDMAFNLLKVLLERLRRANEKIESLAFTNVHGRVANLLMQFAERRGQQWVIEEKLTHQEIANMIGSSREMVSRILGELAESGHISIDQKRITINKKLG